MNSFGSQFLEQKVEAEALAQYQQIRTSMAEEYVDYISQQHQQLIERTNTKQLHQLRVQNYIQAQLQEKEHTGTLYNPDEIVKREVDTLKLQQDKISFLQSQIRSLMSQLKQQQERNSALVKQLQKLEQLGICIFNSQELENQVKKLFSQMEMLNDKNKQQVKAIMSLQDENMELKKTIDSNKLDNQDLVKKLQQLVQDEKQKQQQIIQEKEFQIEQQYGKIEILNNQNSSQQKLIQQHGNEVTKFKKDIQVSNLRCLKMYKIIYYILDMLPLAAKNQQFDLAPINIDDEILYLNLGYVKYRLSLKPQQQKQLADSVSCTHIIDDLELIEVPDAKSNPQHKNVQQDTKDTSMDIVEQNNNVELIVDVIDDIPIQRESNAPPNSQQNDKESEGNKRSKHHYVVPQNSVEQLTQIQFNKQQIQKKDDTINMKQFVKDKQTDKDNLIQQQLNNITDTQNSFIQQISLAQLEHQQVEAAKIQLANEIEMIDAQVQTINDNMNVSQIQQQVQQYQNDNQAAMLKNKINRYLGKEIIVNVQSVGEVYQRLYAYAKIQKEHLDKLRAEYDNKQQIMQIQLFKALRLQYGTEHQCDEKENQNINNTRAYIEQSSLKVVQKQKNMGDRIVFSMKPLDVKYHSIQNDFQQNTGKQKQFKKLTNSVARSPLSNKSDATNLNNNAISDQEFYNAYYNVHDQKK